MVRINMMYWLIHFNKHNKHNVMKHILYILLGCLLSFNQLSAQEGITFFHGTWAQAKEQAQEADKLIFIDFYTQWCGPCLIMAETVFLDNKVAVFYNDTFVNLKIDAEQGEGKTLAAKYKVRSFPTFLFVNPKTEEIVHASSSRQDAETFIFTGRSALNKRTTSVYLNKEFEKENTDPDFLIDYAAYQGSRYQRKKVEDILVQLKEKGIGLSDKRIWNLFDKYILNVESPISVDFLKQFTELTHVHGAQCIQNKLFSLYRSQSKPQVIALAPDFKGKQYLIKKAEVSQFIKAKQYDEAAVKLSALMAETSDYKQDLCSYLQSLIRRSEYQKSTEKWEQQCVVMARYAAYNNPDRKDGMAHYRYALLLEKLLKKIPDAEQYVPEGLLETPVAGQKEYTMRSPKLKQKPGTGKSRR